MKLSDVTLIFSETDLAEVGRGHAQKCLPSPRLEGAIREKACNSEREVGSRYRPAPRDSMAVPNLYAAGSGGERATYPFRLKPRLQQVAAHAVGYRCGIAAGFGDQFDMLQLFRNW